VYVGGYGYPGGSTSYGYELLTWCLSASTGTTVWWNSWHSPYYSSSSSDYVRAITVEGNYVITGGYGYWTSSTGYEFNVVAYNKINGAKAWDNHWGATTTSNTDYLYDLCSDGAGKVYACGYVYGAGYGADWGVVAFSATSGAVLWSDTYNGVGYSFHTIMLGP
jgi:hypothetical protein